MPRNPTTSIRAILIDETDKAYEIRQEEDNREVVRCWLPKSEVIMSKLPLSKKEQEVFAKTFERPVVIKVPEWIIARHNLYPEA